MLERRLEACARHEGLPGFIRAYMAGGLSEQQIRTHLRTQGFSHELTAVLPTVALQAYLENKYGLYVWEGYRENHLHEEDYQILYGQHGVSTNKLLGELDKPQ